MDPNVTFIGTQYTISFRKKRIDSVSADLSPPAAQLFTINIYAQRDESTSHEWG